MEIIFFTIMGYLSGSILFARLSEKLFNKENMIEKSKDANPGAANAFMNGGFCCGMFTLLGDILKGFIPVYLYCKLVANGFAGTARSGFVLAAPVLGHAFPLFYQFKGGKGIAVSFGALLGLVPNFRPVLCLAVAFIFFSLIVKITPHFYRTLVTYVVTFVIMLDSIKESSVIIGFLMIATIVIIRLHLSKEKREDFEVKMIWKH